MENTSTFTIAPFLPLQYYFAKGSGQCDLNIEGGAYQNAMFDMNAGNLYNVDLYLLPSSITKIGKPSNLDLGQCAPAVICKINGVQGENISSCIVIGWMQKEKDGDVQFGILTKAGVVEDESIAFERCKTMLNKIASEYYPDYIIKETEHLSNSIHVSQKYGTAITAIVFNEMTLPFKGF